MLPRQKIKRAVISTSIAALFLILTAFIAFGAFGFATNTFFHSLCSVFHVIPLAISYDGASDVYIALYYIFLWLLASFAVYFVLGARRKDSGG